MRLALAALLLLPGLALGQAFRLDTTAARLDGSAAGSVTGPGGATTNVQFNDAGTFLGTAGLTFAKASGALSGTGPWTLTPAGDFAPLTVRAYSSGTAAIIQWQTSANGALGNISHAGAVTAPQFLLSVLNAAPSAPTDACPAGEIRITADYLYLCAATGDWRRSALTTWTP